MTDRTDQVARDADPWAALPQEIRDAVQEYGLTREEEACRYERGGGMSVRDSDAARTALASALLPLMRDRERIDWLARQLRDSGDHLPSGWSLGDVTLYGSGQSIGIELGRLGIIDAPTLRDAIDKQEARHV